MTATLSLDVNIVDIVSLYDAVKELDVRVDYHALYKALPKLREMLRFDTECKVTSEAFLAINPEWVEQRKFMTTLRNFGYQVDAGDFRLTRFHAQKSQPINVGTVLPPYQTLSDVISARLGQMDGQARATGTMASAVVISSDLRLRRTLLRFTEDENSPFYDNLVLAFPQKAMSEGWRHLLQPNGPIAFYDLANFEDVIG